MLQWEGVRYQTMLDRYRAFRAGVFKKLIGQFEYTGFNPPSGWYKSQWMDTLLTLRRNPQYVVLEVLSVIFATAIKQGVVDVPDLEEEESVEDVDLEAEEEDDDVVFDAWDGHYDPWNESEIFRNVFSPSFQMRGVSNPILTSQRDYYGPGRTAGHI